MTFFQKRLIEVCADAVIIIALIKHKRVVNVDYGITVALLRAAVNGGDRRVADTGDRGRTACVIAGEFQIQN